MTLQVFTCTGSALGDDTQVRLQHAFQLVRMQVSLLVVRELLDVFAAAYNSSAVPSSKDGQGKKQHKNRGEDAASVDRWALLRSDLDGGEHAGTHDLPWALQRIGWQGAAL
jgi:hypothetical protein